VTQVAQWILLGLACVIVVLLLTNEQYRLNFLQGPAIVKGALVAAIGIGIVLTYKGSGVINFANGAIAMYCAYFYALLRRDGDILVPPLPNPLVLIEAPVNWFRESGDFLDLPDWPTRVSVGPNMQVIPAVLITLLFGLVLGLLLHFLIFRPLRPAPVLAKVVASIGLLLLLQAIVVRRFGSVAVSVPKLYDTQPVLWEFPFGVRFSREQLYVVILVVIVTAALWALFRFARFGLATRAAAENEKGALVLGFSPDMLAGSNWVLSTMLAALFGMVAASADSSVDPVTITLLVIPALSAVLVGNLSSFWITALAAFLISMAKPVILFAGTKSWFPKSGTIPMPGIGELLPFIVIVLVLFLRGDALPTRGAIISGRLPFAATPGRVSLRIVGPILIAVTFVSLLLLATPNGRLGITNTLVGVVIALSFVVLTGFVGQISLAQLVLAGVSGFLLSKLAEEQNVPFPIAPLLAAAGATIVGLLVAIPALRVRGVNLAIVTFAFAVAMQEFMFKNPTINGGLNGSRVRAPGPIDPLKTVAISRGIGVNPWFGVFCLAVAAACCYAIANVRRSATGRMFLATRSNERAAAAAGVNVSATKLLAFGTAAFVAGIAGALSSYRFGTVNPEYFGGLQSLTFFAFAYLGGISGVSGAVAAGFLVPGGIMFTMLDSVFGVPGEFAPILGGIGLILTAILNPEGIAGGLRLTMQRWGAARRSPTADDLAVAAAHASPGAGTAEAAR
jgi:branched-chain amino acid transport system permease protein